MRQSKLLDGEVFSRALVELEASHYIKRFIPFDGSRSNAYLQLVDPYVRFFQRWVTPIRQRVSRISSDYWLRQSQTQAYRSWVGFGFELVCLTHLDQILTALGISGIQVLPSTWRAQSVEGGAQIDIVLDRADRIINLCEVKFTLEPLVVDKSLRDGLALKRARFIAATKTKRAVTSIVVSGAGFAAVPQRDSTMAGFVTGQELF